MRCFVAVSIPESSKQKIRSLQMELESFRSGVRWVNPDSQHLTLKFLGEIEPSQVGFIGDVLEKTTREFSTISLEINSLGAFPSLNNPRVFWVGVRDKGQNLLRLVRLLEARLEPLGVPRENRKWSPHVTLGRVKKGFGLKQVCDYIRIRAQRFDAGRFSATHVVLFRSVLRPSGARYEPQGQYPFTTPGSDGSS